jgi:hypothetical protein
MKTFSTKMKLSTMSFFLLTSLSSDVALAGKPSIISGGIQVISSMGDNGIADKFFDNAKILSSRGLTPDWPAAIAGEGNILRDKGNIQIIKIHVIPFIDAPGLQRSSIITGIVKSEGQIIEEFIFIADSIDSSIITPAIGISPKKGTEIEPLIRAIETGDRSNIWSIILSGTIPSASIRAAYEINGYACGAVPTGFPEAGIWYAATCVRSAH